MWTYEHSVDTAAAPEAVWQQWVDVANWGIWNADIQKIEATGPFVTGTRITMHPAGQDPVELTLAQVSAPEVFVDEARFAGLLFRTAHRVTAQQGGARITYRMEITGAAADEIGPQVGPGITADWPQTMAALARRAEARC
ncbi:SRPBCC family protein [Streptomyces sp. NPDC059456]|uniref:SRPBCC family protein n=1 Tax=Streptomyces sp. NPDC059456 TaxID=3346838 RepID=UPI0036AE1589